MSTFLVLDWKCDGNIVRLLPSEIITDKAETTYGCPYSREHNITSNKDKIFCEECGVWWNNFNKQYK